MVENTKCLQYYDDSKTYTNSQIEQSIENTRKEFAKKDIKVEIHLNEFGVYVVTFFIQNKDTYFRKIVLNLKKEKEKIQESEVERKQNKKQSRIEKYYGENKYGKYKPTKTYKPF